MKNELIPSWIFFIVISTFSCSNLAKKLKPPNIRVRTYRFCSFKEMKDPFGKICYRFCSEKTLILKKCKKTELIVEDLSKPQTYQKFFNAGFLIKIREDVTTRF